MTAIPFTTKPTFVGGLSDPFRESLGFPPANHTRAPFGNFIKHLAWSPDGIHLASNAEDGHIRIFSLPPSIFRRGAKDPDKDQDRDKDHDDDTVVNNDDDNHIRHLRPSVVIDAGERVHDITWCISPTLTTPWLAYCPRAAPIPIIAPFPHLEHSNLDPDRASKRHRYATETPSPPTPIGSYFGLDRADEPETAYAISFPYPPTPTPSSPHIPPATHFAAAYREGVRIHALSRPGRAYAAPLLGPPRGKGERIRGPISCLDWGRGGGGQGDLDPNPARVAVGSFGGDVGVLDARSGDLLSLASRDPPLAITHVRWGVEREYLLWCAARRDDTIRAWDVRQPDTPLVEVATRRAGTTHQRLGLDTERRRGGRWAVGSVDGTVQIIKEGKTGPGPGPSPGTGATPVVCVWSCRIAQTGEVNEAEEDNGEGEEDSEGDEEEHDQEIEKEEDDDEEEEDICAVSSVAWHPELPLLAVGLGSRRHEGATRGQGTDFHALSLWRVPSGS